MSKNYVWFRITTEGNAARFRGIENYEYYYKLYEAISLTDDYPADVQIRMNDDFPDSIGLYDVLSVLGGGNFVVSEKMKEFLENAGVNNVQYFPITVLNHKGRKTAEKYVVVNILSMVDCIDRTKTSYKISALDEELMKKISNLTIDESKIDPTLLLFRVKYIRHKIIVRRDFAEKLRDAGFKYFQLSEIEEIDS